MYTCIIGKFHHLACNRNKIFSEFYSILGNKIFPWLKLETMFRPETCNLEYVFDANMSDIASAYEKCGNIKGFESLICVTYNFDVFSSENGLYGKLLIQNPFLIESEAFNTLLAKVVHVFETHIPLVEGQKIKIKSPKINPTASLPQVKKTWTTINIEFSKGTLTQHIMFGEKGSSRKVHIFRKNSGTTYENTPKHLSPKTMPFVKMGGIMSKDNIVHSFNVDCEKTPPDKE